MDSGQKGNTSDKWWGDEAGVGGKGHGDKTCGGGSSTECLAVRVYDVGQVSILHLNENCKVSN